MKAAVLFNTGKPLEICELTIPELSDGQILVKIAYSGVCHSQLMEVTGGRGEDKYLPHLLGHEGSGIVVSIGPSVTKFKVGDRVILGWIKGTGIDAIGAKYKYKDQIINSGGVTTFSEYSVVSENRCTILPESLPLDVAVLFGCAIPTGSGIIKNVLNPNPGSFIAIFGLGGIGLSALMLSKLYNPSLLIAVDVENSKLEMAKKLGATHLINASVEDPLKMIMEITGGIGVDYAVEAAGLTSTIEKAFDSVKRKGGLLVFASHPKHGEKIKIDPFELINGKNIRGSWGGESNPDLDIPYYAKLFIEGKLPLDLMITKKYKLNEVNEALMDLKNHKVNRPVLEIHPS